MILGQLTMGARQTKNAPLTMVPPNNKIWDSVLSRGMKAKVVFCPIMRHFGKTAFPLRFLPSCSSVWFAVFFFGFPPPELETSKMSITPNVKTIYGRQVQNKKYSEPEIRGDCSGTKFAREQLKIFASLTYEVSIKKIVCSTYLSFIKVAISEIVHKQIICLCFLLWRSSLG